MGNAGSSTSGTSTRVLQTPLAPQPRFPRVVNSRFVLDYVTTLRLPQNFWCHAEPQPLQIADVDTGAVLFRVNARGGRDAGGDASSKRRPQLLLDKNGVPIAALQGVAIAPDCATYIPYVPLPASVVDMTATPAGSTGMSWLESRALCFLETNLRPLEKRLLLELEDPVTRDKFSVRVDGSWSDHEAIFWVDRGLNVARECIARVYLDPDAYQARKALKKLKHKPAAANSGAAARGHEPLPAIQYRVDIAPGVDVALIVLACAALDEELRKKESGVAVEIGEDQLTTRLAQRHHRFRPRDSTRRSTNGKTMFYVSDYCAPSGFAG